MLSLKNICKSYMEGEEKKVILDNINLNFKDKELVFILGASGSGKSTLLNIISGNLKCDSGEIWFDDVCITDFKDKELDNYRSSIIGNIFQDYNLIDYMHVIDNIMLGYNNGLSKKDIGLLLRQLNIYDKQKMLVNKLSGGEKQRVAIARALVNNPDIVLADEPTGALDSKNGIMVMEILKRIANDKLVIVVSHDVSLANKYASRIINIKDGKCDGYNVDIKSGGCSEVRKRKKNYLKILKLAIKNLCLKLGRSFFTSLAVSLGIVSMLLIVNLYSNIDNEVDELEKNVVSVFPIVIKNGDYVINGYQEKKGIDKIIVKNKNEWIHTNKINQNYLNYLNRYDEIKYKTYKYDISMPIISGNYKLIDKKYIKTIPGNNYIIDNYDIIYGRNIKNEYEVLLKIDSNNNVDSEFMDYFNIYNDVDYNTIIGKTLAVVLNDEYYLRKDQYYIGDADYKNLYSKSKIVLSIVGIIKEKQVTTDDSFLYYSDKLVDRIISENKDSDIVLEQLKTDYSVLGLNKNKDEMLSYLGYNTLPSEISLYFQNVDDKNRVIKAMDAYNQHNDKLIYMDSMAETIKIVKNFVMIISGILVLFSTVGVIISTLMIGILTNVRILERKKEIGILRSLGYHQIEVKRLFNFENMILGILASLISLIIVNILVPPINNIMDKYMEVKNVLHVNYGYSIMIIIVNIIIVVLAGDIFAKKASKMDITKCIYNL